MTTARNWSQWKPIVISLDAGLLVDAKALAQYFKQRRSGFKAGYCLHRSALWRQEDTAKFEAAAVMLIISMVYFKLFIETICDFKLILFIVTYC
tara:strand:+ start:1297 stop:1578 length:282 start_codon:yes stop_codon:yes gene_type:complete